VLSRNVKYHPIWTKILTFRPESTGGTVIGGQFDWGGSLLKSNKGAQRLAQAGRQSAEECKRISQLNCKSDRTRRYESRG
jgi:hypothetical protein